MHSKFRIKNFLATSTLAVLIAATGFPLAANAADLVRLGNLKFAHYGAVAYMKELAPKYNLKIDSGI